DYLRTNFAKLNVLGDKLIYVLCGCKQLPLNNRKFERRFMICITRRSGYIDWKCGLMIDEVLHREYDKVKALCVHMNKAVFLSYFQAKEAQVRSFKNNFYINRIYLLKRMISRVENGFQRFLLPPK